MNGQIKNILVLGKGDTPNSDLNRAMFVKCVSQAGFDVREADYNEIKKVRGFRGERINVMFFFPYTFWNANCEAPESTQPYGTSRHAYEKFKDYFLEVQNELEQKFCGQRLCYTITPENAPIDRDKVETIYNLMEQKVPTSVPLPYNSLRDITSSISPERGVFIKCRYGAEGKGITVLHNNKWVTNYKVESGKLTNHGVYGQWPFTDITGRDDLLDYLLQHSVIVEKEILTPNVYDGKKFDLRAYVVGEKVPHFFVRINAPQKEVTNFSQGALIIHHPHTGLSEEDVRLISQTSIQAAKSMSLRFAGVDIMFDGDMNNPKVIELQVFPRFPGFPDFTRFDLIGYMASDASGLFI